ncbi:MAG: DUF4386 domain-containing protein [Ekhidna sp.]|uniref:DUF4386 domain-containing protein n=1 Tax=Ekhidna sp. TaxID=2608089 RepID=UPI0032EE486E
MNEIDSQKNAVKWLRIIYPVWAAIGMFSIMYVPSELIDISNPALTASNIAENEILFRLGIAGSLVTQLLVIAAVWFLYKLFYTNYKDATILVAIFALVGVPIDMLSTANELMVLDALDQPDQVVDLIKQSRKGTSIATIFWGLWLLPIGYMIIKSPLFPRLIGWLVILAGAAYTIMAFASLLNIKGPIISALDYLTFGELIWMLWVMILGARWKALEH